MMTSSGLAKRDNRIVILFLFTHAFDILFDCQMYIFHFSQIFDFFKLYLIQLGNSRSHRLNFFSYFLRTQILPLQRCSSRSAKSFDQSFKKKVSFSFMKQRLPQKFDVMQGITYQILNQVRSFRIESLRTPVKLTAQWKI